MTRALCLTLISIALVACAGGSPSPSPSPPPAAGLDGRTFLSLSVTENDLQRALVPNTRIRLSFGNGQLGASVGCNSMSALYQLDGAVLLIANAGMTEIGCDPARQAQDNWLFGLLGGRPTLALASDTLTVTLAGTVVQLLDREIAEPDAELVGPLWVVESIIAGEAVSSVPQGARATMQFDAAGGVTLATGCNSGGGRVAVDGTQLRFIDIVTTQQGCTGAAGALEAAVMVILNADAVAFTIEAQTLTLHASGQGLQPRAATSAG